MSKKAYFLIVLTLTSRLSSPSGLLDIYFHQRNAQEHAEALQLRDAVLRLRRDGVFVAVPLFRVNTDPIGPHPVGQQIFWIWRSQERLIGVSIGSYEIWCPSETFSSVFSYLSMHRGNLRCASSFLGFSTIHQLENYSILIHPLTRDQVKRSRSTFCIWYWLACFCYIQRTSVLSWLLTSNSIAHW